MMFIKLLCFIALVEALGYLILLFWPRFKLLTSLVIAWALGGVFISWQLFVAIFYFRLNVNQNFVWLLILELAILYWWQRRRGNVRWPDLNWRGEFSKIEALVVLLITLLFLVLCSHVLSIPTINFDALAHWALRVKILMFYQGGLLDHNSLYYWQNLAHSNYPWHLSLLGWLQLTILGQYSETWINFLPMIYFVGLIMTCYALAKESLNRLWSLFICLMVMVMPLVFYHAYNFYADLSLAFYIAVYLLVWRQWLKDRLFSSLLLLSCLAGAALTVKTDAIIFVGLLALLVLFEIVKSKQWRQLMMTLIVLTSISLPWFAWVWQYNLGIRNVPAGWGWHPEVLDQIFNSFFISQNWHIWWYVLIVFISLGWRSAWSASVSFRYQATYFLLAMFSIFAIYLFTESYIFAVGNEALSRNIILLIPISVAVGVDCLAVWQKRT